MDKVHDLLRGCWSSVEPIGETPVLPMITSSAEDGLQPGVGYDGHPALLF